jgi:hypothetical protein
MGLSAVRGQTVVLGCHPIHGSTRPNNFGPSEEPSWTLREGRPFVGAG